MKKIIAIVLSIIAVIAAGLVWLTGNMDSLIKQAIVDHGSAMTQATVRLDTVTIAPADGKGVIGHLLIGNPAGFKTPHAMKVALIEVDIDVTTLTKDVIMIRRIAIKSPDVIYEKGESMTNIDAIQRNIASYLGSGDKGKQDGKGRKLMVQELTIRDAKAQASAAFMNGKTITVPLPDIVLKDIGKAKGGVTPAELGQEVTSALKAKLGSAVSFDRLLTATGETLEKAGTAIKGLLK